MSEEILRALMQLFAIITKQDGGVTPKERSYVEVFLKQLVDRTSVLEYLILYDEFSEDPLSSKLPFNLPKGGGALPSLTKSASKNGTANSKVDSSPPIAGAGTKLTSVKDSLRTLSICKKINKTLGQKQKVVVLVRLFELVKSDEKLTPQRMQIIDTVSSVFNIPKEEYKVIENFILNDTAPLSPSEGGILPPPFQNILVLDSLSFLKVESVDMYFVKYLGKDDVLLNGLVISTGLIYLFANGSTIKLPKASPVFYSDIVGHYLKDKKSANISFNAKKIHYSFPNGNIGIRDVNLSEGSGKLIGIMGASGAGKTTLFNILTGIEKPSNGKISINGVNIHTEKDKIEGVIGYISQDDILFEDLTVYQNLYYNAKLCFDNLPTQQIKDLVLNTLKNLGLSEIKDIKVGNVLNKLISGGQRKRLNIALELIREPSLMFVDEPTTGLSSRDAENIMDLLKELTLKGKLIFVVIHQPSSEIYKMFDKMLIMDIGGYPIYYGNPVEAIIYFKKITNQINSEKDQCTECGNVNPEQLFNIIEAKVVDEYGSFTEVRKIDPLQWNDYYRENIKPQQVKPVKEALPSSLNLPSIIKQMFIFTTRDVLTKVSNIQYLLINLLEAPVLALLLTGIIWYIEDPKSEIYYFGQNENLPAYLFMSIIVALFMGLTVSAEEIIRDRKILKREAFLNLSKTSYLFSKITILFFLSAIQTLSYVVVGNLILNIQGMTIAYWAVLFSCSCFANVLGLNISASFNSAVTIYILIPILLIPQMILSGAIFNFDKLNHYIGSKAHVPIIADIMTSRWAFEALTVHQYKNNEYENQKLGKATLYDVEKKVSAADFKQGWYVPELKKRATECINLMKASPPPTPPGGLGGAVIITENLQLLKRELTKINLTPNTIQFKYLDKLDINNFNLQIADSLSKYIDRLKAYYIGEFSRADFREDIFLNKLQDTPEKEQRFRQLKLSHFNEELEEIVKNRRTKHRIIEYNGELLQKFEPIYLEPDINRSILDFRTHFYAPNKRFLGTLFDTLYFNITIIWIMSIILYITLYFDTLKWVLDIFEKLKNRF
ncbi:MAG: ATP-binding cassette domain-containing protein [Bacteroidetes bacterium]|nr:ATP-binding cassette domain-containing protein [Bacteroidota bacterium]